MTEPGSSDSRRPLSWGEVHAFLAVVQAGSISAAAQRPDMNHSTVLRRIVNLEHTLSTRLFDRLPTGYALTTAGHEFAERLSGMADQIEAAHRHLSSRDIEIRGTIRMAAPELRVTTVLMPIFARFSLRYPAVQLQLVMANTRLNLTRREADVAIRVSNNPPENLVGRRIGRVESALHASRACLTSLPPGATLVDYRWVALDESLANLNQALWMRRDIDLARVAIQVDGADSLVEAVACGAGTGLLPCSVADMRADLVQLAPPDPTLDWSIWILTHPDLRQVVRIRVFTEFVFDTLDDEGTLR